MTLFFYYAMCFILQLVTVDQKSLKLIIF